MIFTEKELAGSGLPDHCQTDAIINLNTLPHQYSLRLAWHTEDGKGDIKNLNVGTLKDRKKKLERALAAIQAALLADENQEYLIEGDEQLSPSPVVGAYSELKRSKSELEAAIGRYSQTLESIGSGNIPAVQPRKWLALQLFNFLYNFTGSKPNYTDQLVWCRLIVQMITGKSISHSVIQALLDDYQPTKYDQNRVDFIG